MVGVYVQGNRPDVPERDRTEDDAEVVCAYDDVDGVRSLLVADVTRDDAWLAVGAADALDVDAWR